MPTYVFRCESCMIDWDKEFAMSQKPDQLPCPKCYGIAKAIITTAPGVHFGAGFPGNDMKNAVTGKSEGQPGRKPTHKEMEYAEEKYPDMHKANKELQRAQDEFAAHKSGSKHGDFGKR